IAAVAELEFAGLSARLPLTVKFDPAQLLKALFRRAGASGLIAYQDVTRFLAGDPATLPLQLSAPAGASQEQRSPFAEAMADRLRAHFVTFAPSPRLDSLAYWQLPDPSTVLPGNFEWDLSAPEPTARPCILTFDPLDAVRSFAEKNDTSQIIEHVKV